MHVLAHEPHAWFLLESNGQLFLDVNCSHSAFSYPMLIELLPTEAAEYYVHGNSAIRSLSSRVQFSGLSEEMQSRNLTKELGDEVTEAIAIWRGNGT
jgi:hypothetical protein